MLKKITLITPVLMLSVAMSACSTTKQSKTPKAMTAVTVQKATPVIAADAIAPIVYEKRSPKPRRNYTRRNARSKYRRASYSRPRSRARRPQQRTFSRGFSNQLSNAALGRLRSRVRYDGSYYKIGYPWGDVPANIGVCTDVVIRSYRKLGVDLQQQVHQDMTSSFAAYPNLRKWGLSKPDTNIDHRRVYNLRAFFARRGASLPITHNPTDYKPGDIVSWIVGPNLPHIGMVVNRPSKADPRRMMIVHNIAEGPQMEDVLFRFRITGHYRYTRKHMGNIPNATYASRKSRSRSRANNMNYNQLLKAANMLAGTPTRSKRRLSRVDAANLSAKTSRKSLQLATLNKNAVRELLAR